MGNQHVPLTINEDGLVTSVGNLQSEEIYETCVLCGEKTDVKITTHIDYRYGYVEGSGQCCRNCYNKTYSIQEEDYVTKVMKLRTTLVTISAEDILNTPNDYELGEKVRRKYWELTKENTNQNNIWVCEICGKDTSDVEYDYLIGTNHLSCCLKKEQEDK
jgi:rubrerythrin